jgi:hypothetical protein
VRIEVYVVPSTSCTENLEALSRGRAERGVDDVVASHHKLPLIYAMPIL